MRTTRLYRWLTVLACLLAGSAYVQAQLDAIWKTYHDAGWKACREGNYKDGRKFLELAVKEGEKLGPNDPRLGMTLVNLAWLNAKQGRIAEVELFSQRARTIFQKATGPETIELARALKKRYHLYGFIVKEDEGHGFFKEENRLELWNKVDEFLKATLR